MTVPSKMPSYCNDPTCENVELLPLWFENALRELVDLTLDGELRLIANPGGWRLQRRNREGGVVVVDATTLRMLVERALEARRGSEKLIFVCPDCGGEEWTVDREGRGVCSNTDHCGFKWLREVDWKYFIVRTEVRYESRDAFEARHGGKET